MKRNLYAAVHPTAARRDWRVYAAAAVALALLLAAAIPILWSVRYQLRFRTFVRELSTSTTESYRTESLTVERNGETVPLSGDCGYQIYSMAAGLTPGRWGKPPEEDAAVTLYYGDGSTLSFWEVPLSNQASSTGLFLWYTDSDGKSDGFSSSLLHLSGVERLLDQDAERGSASGAA